MQYDHRFGFCTILQRAGKRDFSARTQKDHKKSIVRRKRNDDTYQNIANTLTYLFQGINRKTLLIHAQNVSKASQVPLDRLAKRNFECLVCWFCENWPKIQHFLFDYAAKLKYTLLVESNNSQFSLQMPKHQRHKIKNDSVYNNKNNTNDDESAISQETHHFDKDLDSAIDGNGSGLEILPDMKNGNLTYDNSKNNLEYLNSLNDFDTVKNENNDIFDIDLTLCDPFNEETMDDTEFLERLL